MIFHVGVGKTATTTLQRNIFMQCSAFSALTPYNDGELLSLFHQEHDYLGSLKKIEQKIKQLDKNKTCIISHEELIHHPFLIARKIKDIAPKSTIILTIREQKDALLSQYKSGGYMLKPAPQPYNGRVILFNDYLDYLIENQDLRQWARLDYFKLYEIFNEHDLNVRILPYEMLKKAPSEYAAMLADICGVSEDLEKFVLQKPQNVTDKNNKGKASSSVMSKAITVVRNPLIIQEKKKLRTAKESNFSDKYKRIMDKKFKLSNSDLSGIFRMDLKDLGYAC